ncbi:MAG: hypothetical protein ACP5HW_01110 [Candidatus Micrarchaeia archaeon]
MPEGIFSSVSPAAKLYEEVFRYEQSNIVLQVNVPTSTEIVDTVRKYLKEAGIEVFDTKDCKGGVIITTRGEYGKLSILTDVFAEKFKGMGVGDIKVLIEGPREEDELVEYPSNVKVNARIRISFKTPLEL